MTRKYVSFSTTARDRLQRQVANSILANATRVCSGNMFEPKEPNERASKIARLVAEDILKKFRLVRRK